TEVGVAHRERHRFKWTRRPAVVPHGVETAEFYPRSSLRLTPGQAGLNQIGNALLQMKTDLVRHVRFKFRATLHQPIPVRSLHQPSSGRASQAAAMAAAISFQATVSLRSWALPLLVNE